MESAKFSLLNEFVPGEVRRLTAFAAGYVPGEEEHVDRFFAENKQTFLEWQVAQSRFAELSAEESVTVLPIADADEWIRELYKTELAPGEPEAAGDTPQIDDSDNKFLQFCASFVTAAGFVDGGAECEAGAQPDWELLQDLLKKPAEPPAPPVKEPKPDNRYALSAEEYDVRTYQLAFMKAIKLPLTASGTAASFRINKRYASQNRIFDLSYVSLFGGKRIMQMTVRPSNDAVLFSAADLAPCSEETFTITQEPGKNYLEFFDTLRDGEQQPRSWIPTQEQAKYIVEELDKYQDDVSQLVQK